MLSCFIIFPLCDMGRPHFLLLCGRHKERLWLCSLYLYQSFVIVHSWNYFSSLVSRYVVFSVDGFNFHKRCWYLLKISLPRRVEFQEHDWNLRMFTENPLTLTNLKVTNIIGISQTFRINNCTARLKAEHVNNLRALWLYQRTRIVVVVTRSPLNLFPLAEMHGRLAALYILYYMDGPSKMFE